MPENILVVEYEPRYTDRVKQALSGQPFQPQFAKDGDEALRALDGAAPRLIVISSVVPKVSTPELIRAIRNRKLLAQTPILLTVSGYNGKSPKQDAARMGASDILPKPYSENEFLGKVQQMLGVRPEPARQWTPELDGDFTVRAMPSDAPAGGNGADGLTSNQIFGELLEDDRAASTGAKKAMKPPMDDLDKMLADTLSGVRPQKKKEAAPSAPATPQAAPVTPPASSSSASAPTPAEAKPRTQPGSAGLDKLLEDTLSGLDRQSRKTVATTPIPQTPATPKPPQPVPPPRPQQVAPQPAPQPPRPATPPPAAAKPAVVPPPVMPTTEPKYTTARMPTFAPEKIPVSQPVFAPAPPPVAHEEEEPTDGVTFGQYVLLEKIATGGMAEVWKARMRGVEGFQKIVAIKKILPHLSDNQDFIEMFIDEAKLAAQLNHNNIIHIYDLGKIQSSYYIAMEYIDGYDLKTILKKAQEKDQPLSVELALFVASKIAAALDYAHRKRDFEDKDLGLVHRDVSPQNVLISEEGDIKLCDFGIAKAASKASHTQAGALKGKLQYMSPEQAWGRNIDKRSDIFALATVLFEMLTGRKLFTGDNELSILEQVREARITPPSHFNDEVTPQIDAIVAKALEKDPANRYQTAGEMEREINQVLYTFRPTPTSADLAIYMHRLSNAETVMHPMSEASIAEPEDRDPRQLKPAVAPVVPMPVAAAPVAAAIPPPPAAALSYEEPPPEKKSPVALIAVGAVVLVAVIGGVIFMMRGKSSTPATAVTRTTTTTTSATKTASASSAAVPVTTSGANAAAAPTGTAIDAAKVDAEVQKRLAAEKAKIEQDAKAKQQQTTTAAPATQQRPPQVAQAQPVVPQQTPAPVPQPVVQQPAPQPAVQQPAPQVARNEPPPAAAPARAKEGELIPAGTEGLTPPRIVSQANAVYPQIARMERVQGIVIVSVLVSETGKVLDVKTIRGDPRLVDAAVQSMRRSAFSPGQKDGVRVKSWIPVAVSFKL